MTKPKPLSQYTRDADTYIAGIAYLFGSLQALMSQVVSGTCSIERATVEFHEIHSAHDDLHNRFIRPLAEQPHEQPHVQTPLL